MLFTEHPLLQRPAAARAAGFSAIEFWWPWPQTPRPPRDEVEQFIAAVRAADVELIGLNFFAGDLAGPDCGVLSLPERSAQFRANLDIATHIGEQLGVRAFNALYGNRVDGLDPALQSLTALDSLTAAGEAAARIGATVLIEAVSGPKPYPLRSAEQAAEVVAATRDNGTTNIAMLCDLFHLANTAAEQHPDRSVGQVLTDAIERFTPITGHVQIADWPGRGEPGSGQLDLERYLALLAQHGYDGWVGLEYRPTEDTDSSLAWLPVERRSA
jgi:hydroxypyruvate isomerase